MPGPEDGEELTDLSDYDPMDLSFGINIMSDKVNTVELELVELSRQINCALWPCHMALKTIFFYESGDGAVNTCVKC